MHRLRSSSRKPIHASFPNYYGKIIKNKNVQTASYTGNGSKNSGDDNQPHVLFRPFLEAVEIICLAGLLTYFRFERLPIQKRTVAMVLPNPL